MSSRCPLLGRLPSGRFSGKDRPDSYRAARLLRASRNTDSWWRVLGQLSGTPHREADIPQRAFCIRDPIDLTARRSSAREVTLL